MFDDDFEKSTSYWLGLASQFLIGYDFQQSVCFWMSLTSHLFENDLSNELANTDLEGIGPPHIQIMTVLALGGETSQHEIVLLLPIEPSELLRVLDRLEQHGLIEQFYAPEDRQKKMVRLTEKVTAEWAFFIQHCVAVEEQATAGLSGEQLQELQATLTVIWQNLGLEFKQKVAMLVLPESEIFK